MLLPSHYVYNEATNSLKVGSASRPEFTELILAIGGKGLTLCPCACFRSSRSQPSKGGCPTLGMSESEGEGRACETHTWC